MKIKRLKSIKINSYTFKINWNKNSYGGSIDYTNEMMVIGCKSGKDDEIFMILNHEIMEICTIEMNVRLNRPDCDSDYIFVFDHRQFETLINMYSGIISRFIK